MQDELGASIEYIVKERNISREVLVTALQSALLSACKKTFPNGEDINIEIDPLTFKIKLLENGKERFDARFGRIAAQTAKQVIIQKLREAERDSIYSEFQEKEGDIITGRVHAIEKKCIIVDLGKAEAILPIREQVARDRYRRGDVIRAYVSKVKMDAKGPEIILSRVSDSLVSRLFELEVPEISSGIVVIKSVARDPGLRSKVAVMSNDGKVDSVGSCVGMRGQRVKNIVNELGGEKIDIVRWSEDAEAFIRGALSPAEVGAMKLDHEQKKAEVTVPDDQFNLAQGRREQNVRLACKLTGWNISLKTASGRPANTDETIKETDAEPAENTEAQGEVLDQTKEESGS